MSIIDSLIPHVPVDRSGGVKVTNIFDRLLQLPVRVGCQKGASKVTMREKCNGWGYVHLGSHSQYSHRLLLSWVAVGCYTDA